MSVFQGKNGIGYGRPSLLARSKARDPRLSIYNVRLVLTVGKYTNGEDRSTHFNFEPSTHL